MEKLEDGILTFNKYTMDILKDTHLMNVKHVDTPTDPNAKLLPN
jgi:hypothetical protein